MTRISHAPEGYICPFCLLVQGIENKHVGSKQADISYKDDYITGFIASHWWPNNPGHALVIPNQHIENIYVSRTIEQVASQLAPDDDHYTLGAFIGDGLAKIVGTVTLVRERSPKVRHIANLVAMYVSPDTRRKGVGRHLLTELIGRARQLDGLDQLRLCVIQDNPAAIRLYRSVGFQTFGIEPNALKTADRSWDEVHMVLPFIGEGGLEARFHNQPELSASHGFSHVTINVSNLETSLRFYVGTLGMKLVHRGRRDAYIEWGTAWICLQERPELAPQQPQLGVDHVALYIAPDKFEVAVADLRNVNVPIVRGPVDRAGGWTINFLDPDGTQLEFHTGTLAERMKELK